MASSTANLGLVLPFQSEAVSVTTQNDNLTKIDNAVNGLQDGMAILANGNTHAAIASGQYVYVRNHSSLAEGLYKATTAIATNGTLSTSNLTADSSGGFNDLKAQIDTLNSNFTNFKSTINSSTGLDGIVEPGVHYVNGAGSKWGTMIVTAAGNDVNQFFIQNDGSLVQSRRRTNETWSAWKALAQDSNLKTSPFIPIDVSGTDCDSMPAGIAYSTTGGTDKNFPTNDRYWFVLTIKNSTGQVIRGQFAWNVEVANSKIYFRSFTGAGASDWVALN